MLDLSFPASLLLSESDLDAAKPPNTTHNEADGETTPPRAQEIGLLLGDFLANLEAGRVVTDQEDAPRPREVPRQVRLQQGSHTH